MARWISLVFCRSCRADGPPSCALSVTPVPVSSAGSWDFFHFLFAQLHGVLEFALDALCFVQCVFVTFRDYPFRFFLLGATTEQ